MRNLGIKIVIDPSNIYFDSFPDFKIDTFSSKPSEDSEINQFCQLL